MSFPGADAPSKRALSSPTWLNAADGIERGLLEDGHRVWGFVVYRCYNSRKTTSSSIASPDAEYTAENAAVAAADDDDNDDDILWSRLLATLARCARRSLEVYNGLDLLDSLRMTVIEDRDGTLEGATSAVVRTHFAAWCDDGAVVQEQGDGVTAGLSQRYRYCIWVDDEALESFRLNDEESNNDADEDDIFVNLVWKDWEPSRPDPREPPVEPPLEGSRRPDVGWMRVAVNSIPVVMYELLRDQNSWYGEYRRPPEIICR